MIKKVRVMIFEPYPMGLGGNFLTQKMILQKLDKSKFKPYVVAPQDGAAIDQFRELGIDCRIVNPPASIASYGGKILKSNILNKIKSAYALLWYNLIIYKFLKNEKIDVIYANCVRAEMSTGIAALIAGIPSLLYIKGELSNPLIDRICIFIASKLLFFCTQNRDDKYPNLIRHFSKKIDVLKIGLDPEIIEKVKRNNSTKIRNELNIKDNQINVAILAQLYRPKGQHLAIEALSKIIHEHPNIKLYLLGNHVIEEYQPYKRELETLINKYSLEDHVIFLGWRLDALDIINQMDIILHPSLSEGFGRAVLESMALEKPVIASAVGGLREAIIDGKNGYLIPPGDVGMIASRWKSLVLDKSLRYKMGAEAKQTVFNDYLIEDKIECLANTWLKMGLSR